MNESHFLHGDCQEVLKTVPDESIDLMVTDPPYGLQFMGRNWDKAVPSVAIWQECLRVLKPGAFAFIMSIPRQDCLARMIVNLEDAGFIVAFSPIVWAFASGFPKSTNISKQIDKRKGLEREVIGKYQRPDGTDRKYQTWNSTNGITSFNSDSYTFKDRPLTAPASPEAQALDGAYAGFSPKPALEVILCVMRPLREKTYVDQALANGKGVTWLDSARIPVNGEVTQRMNKGVEWGNRKVEYYEHRTPQLFGSPQGRFPANLLVSSGIDIDLKELLDLQKAIKDA